MFENKVLRKIFGPKEAGIIADWRKVHNEELHNFYSSPNIMAIKSRRVGWARHVARIKAMRHVYKILVEKPEGMIYA
jgi:hypothetical protein